MSDTPVKLNKDGTPRKGGSGRKTGSGSFVNLTLAELNAKFADTTTPIRVARLWAEQVGFNNLVTAPVKDLAAKSTQAEEAAEAAEIEVTVRKL